MKKIIIFSFLLLILGNICQFSSAEELTKNKEVSFVRQIFNFHLVAPGIMRSSQPSEASFKLLKDYCGVKTILNLRDDNEKVEWERQVAEKLGIDFINIPMNGGQKQGADKIEQCLNIIHDKARQPVLVHCWGGKDRTGLICAAYRMKYENWSLADALFEMLAYGYSRSCCFQMEDSAPAETQPTEGPIMIRVILKLILLSLRNFIISYCRSSIKRVMKCNFE